MDRLVVHQLLERDFKKGFAPDLFSISENGVYCIVRGSNNRNKPVIGMTDFVANTMTDYEDDVFGYTAALHVQNDGTVIVSAATGASASSYYQLLGMVGRKLDAMERSEDEPYNAEVNVAG